MRATPVFFGEAVEMWMRPSDFNETAFKQNCTNENGHFLLIRAPEPGLLRLSSLAVTYDASKEYVPSFETTRVREHRSQVMAGQMIENGDHVYAIGRYKNKDGLRFSKLRMYPRHDQPSDDARTDLYGLRLGHSADPNLPYAHRIYGFQLKTAEERAAMGELVQIEDPENALFKELVPIHAFVLHLLTPIVCAGTA